MRENLDIFYFRLQLRFGISAKLQLRCGAALLPRGGAVDLSLCFATTLQVFSYFRGFGTTSLSSPPTGGSSLHQQMNKIDS